MQLNWENMAIKLLLLIKIRINTFNMIRKKINSN